MYLLYLDASGTTNLSDTSSGHYVLAGVCLHDRLWSGLDRRTTGLVKSYAYSGKTPELRAAAFSRTISGQNEISDFEALTRLDRRTAMMRWQKEKLAALSGSQRDQKQSDFKRVEPWIHLTRQERSKLLEACLDFIGSNAGLRLFAWAIDKHHPNVKSGRERSGCIGV